MQRRMASRATGAAHARSDRSRPRALVRALLRRTRHGTLTVVDGGGERDLRRRDAGGPDGAVTVHDRRFYRALLRGSLGVSDAYAEHWFDCDDLPELARLAALNMPALDRWRRAARPFVALPAGGGAAGARATRRAARGATIAAHYDLGNDLFGLMLDETMMYSCAIFERAGERRCTRRRSRSSTASAASSTWRPADHVLEIGTGWGGFAIHAASRYGCRVTTTTISAEQHALAPSASAPPASRTA